MTCGHLCPRLCGPQCAWLGCPPGWMREMNLRLIQHLHLVSFDPQHLPSISQLPFPRSAQTLGIAIAQTQTPHVPSAIDQCPYGRGKEHGFVIRMRCQYQCAPAFCPIVVLMQRCELVSEVRWRDDEREQEGDAAPEEREKDGEFEVELPLARHCGGGVWRIEVGTG